MVAAQTQQPPIKFGKPSPNFLRLIPREYCRRFLVLGAGQVADECGFVREVLRVARSTSAEVAGNVSLAIGSEIDIRVDTGEAIAQDIDRYYGAVGHSGDPATDSAAPADEEAARVLGEADRDLLNVDGKGPVIRLVDQLLFEALSRRASDVHIQPLADRTLIRFRLDGVLHDARELPASLAAAVVTRIKVMSRMDVAERGAPQDGRATVTIGSGNACRSIDLRVSTLPTSYGERAVIRLLDNDRDRELIDLARLGMPADIESSFTQRLQRAHGIVLVTGPTGSGKTTTLYSAIRLIARPGDAPQSGNERNIMTIEDPIEYELSTVGIAVSQTQTNPKKGLTFSTGLRHILRQDPDVVMVGEIRDQDTARIAMQASLTGHLVLSTLHTNDAASAVTRLVDLGIEPYLVSASLSAVLAQRLVRQVHAACRGTGCEECLRSGFRGRLGVFEWLVVDEDVRELVSTNKGERAIRHAARRSGMRSLMEEGRRMVAEGVTTSLEVQRVIQGLEDGAP